MAADERNFRSAYYEKVGFKSVEEKKSLEILLKDKPLDIGKLRQFCLRYCVPATYRHRLWKILLGVLPVHVDCHDFIMQQREQEYYDLLHALNVMKIIDNSTSKAQVFRAMWLLQTGKLTYDINLIEDKGFLPIVQTLMMFFDSDTDIYWLAKKFHDNIQKFEAELPKLIENTYILLEKEEPLLYKHFKTIGVLGSLPLLQYFICCFAGVINELALGKIWDKLCAGSHKILVYVAVALFSNLQYSLSKCTDLPSIIKVIKNIPDETADLIVNSSIDTWQQHGSPLTVYDKPKP